MCRKVITRNGFNKLWLAFVPETVIKKATIQSVVQRLAALASYMSWFQMQNFTPTTPIASEQDPQVIDVHGKKKDLGELENSTKTPLFIWQLL